MQAAEIAVEEAIRVMLASPLPDYCPRSSEDDGWPPLPSTPRRVANLAPTVGALVAHPRTGGVPKLDREMEHNGGITVLIGSSIGTEVLVPSMTLERSLLEVVAQVNKSV
jgi:hypothetical protein